MAEQNTGKITQIIGAVMDIKFSQGKIPEINEAIRVPLEDGGSLTVEVAQDLGDDTVRCIAMGTTDGLRRGMDAIATGAPRWKNTFQSTEKLLPSRNSLPRLRSLRPVSKS